MVSIFDKTSTFHIKFLCKLGLCDMCGGVKLAYCNFTTSEPDEWPFFKRCFAAHYGIIHPELSLLGAQFGSSLSFLGVINATVNLALAGRGGGERHPRFSKNRCCSETTR